MRANIREFFEFLLRFPLIAGFLAIFLLVGLVHAETSRDREVLLPPLRLGVELPYSVLADPSGKLTHKEVSALPTDRFAKRQGAFAAGFTPSAFWLRIDLPAEAWSDQESWLVLSPPFIDSVQVFESTAIGWRQHDGGDLLPLSTREMDYRDFVFRLKPHGDQPLYIRVASTSTIILYGALWQPAAFANQALPEARNWGLYFGTMAFIGILLIGLVVIFRQQRFVVLLLACLFNYGMVAGLQGFHIWLLWPDSPQLASMSLGILVCLGSAMGILLARECLSLSRNFPRIDRLYLAFVGILAIGALSVPLNLYHWVAGWVTLVTELATLGAFIMALILAIRGNRLQLAFAFAFLVHFLAVAPALAINFGLLAPSRAMHTLWQYELIPHMLVIAGIFLFEIRRAHLLWVSEQNEALLATQEARTLLETKVQKRTQDLLLAQASLQSALDSERNAMFEHRQFMAMVSHEFRTPLAVIDATANNLTEAPPLDEDDLQMRANQVLRATRRLTKLTDTCLADARLRDDLFALQWEGVPLETLVREAADIVIWSTKNTLVTDFSGAPQYWRCDPALLRIALSNLLDNAVKYGGPGEVKISVFEVADALVIEVSDQGKGIAEADRARVFERYQRGENVPNGNGGGLGLAVSQMIAKAHGGSIELLNKEIPGCFFALRLPRQESDDVQS